MLRITGILVIILIVIALTAAVSALRDDAHKADSGNAENKPVVEVITLKKASLETTIRLPGDLLPYEAVDIYAKVSGFIETLRADRGSARSFRPVPPPSASVARSIRSRRQLCDQPTRSDSRRWSRRRSSTRPEVGSWLARTATRSLSARRGSKALALFSLALRTTMDVRSLRISS